MTKYMEALQRQFIAEIAKNNMEYYRAAPEKVINGNTRFLGPGGLQKEPCGVSVRSFKVPRCHLPTFVEKR